MIAALLGILGGILVAKKMVSGFYIWIVANIMWIYKLGYSWAGFMFFAYTLLSIYSIYEWKGGFK